jgi:NNP family nitrate/nitrite transporter-like MFS transporter
MRQESQQRINQSDLSGGKVIQVWQPNEPDFWQQYGHRVAQRNLWISVPALSLAFCVWMLFSVVTVNLNQIGFNFSHDQLFMLTALPSVSGALLRVPYSFVIPVFGGRRWTAFSTFILILPCLWLGIVVQDTNTTFNTFMIIALLCGFGGANFASSMANISFFFPKERQGGALGINGGLGNAGVSIMQLVAPIVVSMSIIGLFGSGKTVESGETLWLQNAALVWIPLLFISACAAWFGMNDLSTSQASFKSQLPVLKSPHLWIMSLLYLAAFGSFIGFSAGFLMLAKTQFPDVNILHFAFIGPLVGALARPVGGALSDKLNGVKVTLINFIFMAILVSLVFLTLPSESGQGSFAAFFAVFIGLFLTAGLGSGSTFQMIAVLFRQITIAKVQKLGGSEDEVQRTAATDTAAALGFISAIGALGGFFIPQAFGLSLEKTGSAQDALIIFVVFYVACVLITWLCYARKQRV